MGDDARRLQEHSGTWRGKRRQSSGDCVTLGASPLGPRVPVEGPGRRGLRNRDDRWPGRAGGNRPRRSTRTAVAGTVVRADSDDAGHLGRSRTDGRRPRDPGPSAFPPRLGSLALPPVSPDTAPWPPVVEQSRAQGLCATRHVRGSCPSYLGSCSLVRCLPSHASLSRCVAYSRP